MALSEEGFTVIPLSLTNKHIGKNLYLTVSHSRTKQIALITIDNAHTTNPTVSHLTNPMISQFTTPLSNPNSIEQLIDHLNRFLIPDTSPR